MQTILGTILISLWLLPVSASASYSAVSAQTASALDVNAEERQRGIELYRQEKFAEAEALFQKLTKKNRSHADALYYLGLSLLQEPKDLKEASKAFETALKVRPGFAAAHAGLAYSLLLRNKLSEATREARTALSLDSNIPDAHLVIGVTRLRQGGKEDALQQAEAAIRLNPQFASAYLLKSQALASHLGEAAPLLDKEGTEARKLRFSEAADALEKYLQIAPRDKDKQTWVEQLESLRFYAAPHKTDSRVFIAKDVTMKAQVLSKPEPPYTTAARASGVTGVVILRAVFSSDGTIKHLLVLKGLPLGLTENAIKAARKIKFSPATIDGQPVSMSVQLEYYFNVY